MATAVPVILHTRTATPTHWTGFHTTRQGNDILSTKYNNVDFLLSTGATGDSAPVPDPALVTGTVGALISPGNYYGTVDYPDTEDFRGLAPFNAFYGPIDGGFTYFIDQMVAPEIAYTRISRVGKVFTFTLTTNGFINTGYYTAPYPAPTIYADFGGVVSSVVGTAIGDAHYATFTHDFSSPVRARFEVVDGYGQRSRWYEFRLGPVCSFTVDDGANPVLELDGSQSFDPDGHITNWDWLINSVVETSGETAEYDASSHEGFNIAVNLQVTDNDGLMALCEFVRVPIESNVFHSSLVDAAGHTLVARNDGQNVIVEAFPSGAASRQVRSTITQAKNPSIWRDKSNNLYLLRTDRGSTNAVKTKSRDSGRSWS